MGRSKGDKNIEQRVKNAIVYLKKIKPKYSPKQILHELNLEKNREALHILRGDRLPNERQTFQRRSDNCPGNFVSISPRREHPYSNAR